MSGALVNIPFVFGGLTNSSVANIDADFATLAAFLNNPNNFENYLTDTGTVNACVVAFPAGLTPTLVSGLTVSFIPASSNTGATTLNVSATGVKPLVNQDGTDLFPGQLTAGVTVARAEYNATLGKYVLQGGNISPLVPSSSIAGFTAAVAASALTGTLPAETLSFRSTSLPNGAVVNLASPTAQSLTVPSGATLGTTAGVNALIAWGWLNNAGTLEPFVINASNAVSLNETGIISTTAISAAANSAGVFYSTNARTNVAYRVRGFCVISEAAPGTWATAPSLVQGVGLGSTPAPGRSCIQVYTTPGAFNWTVPPGVFKCKVIVIAGGGAGASQTAAGGNGGSSSFGAYASATGGVGGGYSAVVAAAPTVVGGGAGGVGSSGDLNIAGGGGGGSYVDGSTKGISGAGGNSILGGGGNSVSGNPASGIAGGAYGAGASGASYPGNGACGGGGGGGAAIKVINGLVPGAVIAGTVGAGGTPNGAGGAAGASGVVVIEY